MRGRCDSFVVKTTVHYPTDIHLLWDALRKVILLISRLCECYGLSDWRQYRYNLKALKRCFRQAQKSNQAKGKKSAAAKQAAYRHYVTHAKGLMQKAQYTLAKLSALSAPVWELRNIHHYLSHGQRQASQCWRRVIEGEVIPQDEKVYSIFQPHTEWISKGKAGVPVELGIKVCVLESQAGFILYHRVMENEQDVDVAVDMVKATKAKFPLLRQCSFDKGFYSSKNQLKLEKELDQVVLPKKGRLTVKEKADENEDQFKKARKQHSAVESAINALEVHGLDRCPDHSIRGFKRYVSLAVLGRNIQKLGVILYQQEKEKRYRQAKSSRRKAA